MDGLLITGRSVLQRPLLAPVATGVVALSAALITYLYTPGSSKIFLSCPFFAATGLHCPGCGSTRAVHALTHGDIAAAAHNNVLFFAAVPLLVYAWFAWTAERAGHKFRPHVPIGPRLAWTIFGVVIVFWVARNVGVDVLAPIEPPG